MRKLAAVIPGGVLASVAVSAALAAQSPAPAVPKLAVSHRSTPLGTGLSTLPPAEQTAVVKQYCSPCHNDRMKSGGLTLASFDASQVTGHAETAEKMVRKLRAGMMPPAGVTRPDGPTLSALAASLETAIDATAAERPNPGWRPFQRMNRAEYEAAVRDLLGIDVDVNAFLPPDTISHGFDNVADVQTFSPTLMEGYLRAASQISRLAVGDRNASPGSTTYKLGRVQAQLEHVEGAPIGTRGGISVVHVFPADGEFVFKANMHYEPLGQLYGRSTMTAMNLKEHIEVSVNGERVALLDLNTRMTESDPSNDLNLETPPIHVKAGPQRVSAAFIQNIEVPFDDLLMPLENSLADVSMSYGVTLLPHMRDFTVVGPSSVTGVSDTPSRRRIFRCRPTAPGEEEACATEIVKSLAAAAYRGPVHPQDLRDLLGFYVQGREKVDFENGIRLALQAILASPRFVFRLEEAPGTRRAVRAFRLGDIDLASRLSFFLWGTVPDAELVKAAMAGQLEAPAALEQQVRRMLADPRSEAVATRFASQWFRLQDLDKIVPDYLFYPDYDLTLAAGFKRETELFIDSLVREDRSILDLLTADYTFVNERVARHYGIPNVIGGKFRRVQVPDYRRGILGHGSILTLTSVSDRTSPVLRGKWVMEVLLGSPPPPPPPNVPTLEDVKPSASGKLFSVRERMEEHRKNPACTSCHKVIDPLGLALDNFDPTGAWRIKDNEVPVNPAGVLYDGTAIDGPAALRQALVRHKDAFLLSFTESLMTYALGRRVEYYDMPVVRAIIRDAEKNGCRISSFILGVVNSAPFRMSAAESHTETTEASRR